MWKIRVPVTEGHQMGPKRIWKTKRHAKKNAVHKQLTKCEGCDIVDYERCRRLSFPVGCYWRDRPVDSAVPFGVVKGPQPNQEPVVDVDPGMVRFLRDGACKR
jgi:hypothetical protein